MSQDDDQLLLFAALQRETRLRPEDRAQLFSGLRYGRIDHDSLRASVRQLSCAALRAAEASIVQAQNQKVAMYHVLSSAYPRRLLELPDPPLVIYCRGGAFPKAATPTLGIVGSRKASSRGRCRAQKYAQRFATLGGIVVSGLAYGIDGAAHEGSLSARRSDTHAGIAVLGSGVCSIYPRQHAELAEALIVAGGLVISEFGVDTNPRSYFFLQRNRIIAALSDAVLVVEAALGSGSLTTARHALELGRTVLAVPGAPDDELAWGCNRLLRDGAGMVLEFDDVVESYTKEQKSALKERPTPCGSKTASLHGQSVERAELVQLSHLLQDKDPNLIRVTQMLQDAPQLYDELVLRLNVHPQQLSVWLSELELLGVTEVENGGLFRLSSAFSTVD